MHNNFIEKNRRYINLRPNQVQEIVPEHFVENYPKFIELLEKYYDFQDQTDTTELLKHLFATRDINETDILLLSYIEDELLLGEAYFEGFGETEAQLRAAANFSNVLFRSKGTKFAIEWFFRSFYGVNAEVVYTKENIFKIGDAESGIGADSLRYLTDDRLYQTFALLIRSEIPISQWENVFKLFAHPAGMYLGGEVLITTNIQNNLALSASVIASPTDAYSITILPGSTQDEGTTFTANITYGDSDSGLFWYIENVTTDSGDFGYVVADSVSPNYLEVTSGAASFTIPTALDADEGEGDETFNLIVKDEEGRVKSSSTITLQNVVATYTMTPSATTVGEGEIITFDVTGTNVPNGGNTALDYYVEHITTNDSDFLAIGSPPLTGTPNQFNLIGGVGEFTIDTRIDNKSDDGEQFKVFIRTQDALLRDSATITLNQVAPTFNVLAHNVTEGQPFRIDITADSDQIGNTVDWVLTDSANSDTRMVTKSGSFEITADSATYILSTTTAIDTYQGVIPGTVTVTSSQFYTPDITNNDTFAILDADAVYTITPDVPSAGEGSTVTFDIGGTNIPDGVVYYHIEHITTDDFDFDPAPFRYDSAGDRGAITMSSGVSSPSPTLTFRVN